MSSSGGSRVGGAADAAVLERALGLVARAGGSVLGGSVSDAALRASVGLLGRLEAAVHAEKLRRVAALAERAAHVGAARSTAELVERELGVSRSEARQCVESARALTRLPRTAARARRGELGSGAVREAAVQLSELDRLRVAGAAPDGRAGGGSGDAAGGSDAGDGAGGVVAGLDAAVAAAGSDRVAVRRAAQRWVAEHARGGLADRERRAWRNRRGVVWHKPGGGWRVEAELDERGDGGGGGGGAGGGGGQG